MATNVIVVNGPPRAGKDTLIEMMRTHFEKRGHFVHAISSIDPIREALQELGIDTSQKTPADRKLLAEMGSLLENYCSFRTNWCYGVIKLNADLYFRKSPVIFVHMREPELIDKLQARLAESGIKLWRLFIDSHRAETDFSNPVDAGVYAMKRNFTLLNHSTLEDLNHQAAGLVDLLSMRKEFSRVA